MKKKIVLFVMSLVVMFSILSCGSKSDSKDGASVITILADSSSGWARNFNILSSGVSGLNFMKGFMYEPLVIFDTLNRDREVMWLAEDIITEPDNKTLTVKVRKGIKWSDGEDFNADDVAFTFLYTKDYPEVDKNGDWGENGKIEEVEKIDDYTVKIIMREPNRFHRNNIFHLKWMMPEHIFSQVDNPSSYVLETPVVTGAFSIIKSFTPEMIVLSRNPNFWKSNDLKIDEMRIPQFNGDDAALTLLKTGEVDWAHILIPNIERTYIDGDKNRKYWYPPREALRIAFNHKTKNADNLKAFKNVDFKRALSMAIDRKGIIDSAVYGYLDTTLPPNTGLPSMLTRYRDELADAITKKYAKYDIEAAKQLLADAGFKDVDGDGFVENLDGSKIKFDILSPAGWTDWNDGAAIAAEGFRKIGVDASARAIDLSLIIESWKTGNHDVLYTGHGVSSDIYKFYFDTLGDQSRVLTATWWSITQSNYENDEITALVLKMSTATDEEIKEIASQIERHFAENMINIPLVYSANWFVYNESRFTGWSTEDNPFVQPAIDIHDTKIIQLLALEPVL